MAVPSKLSAEIFRDETKAREWLENELWPEGPLCPHCGVLNGSTKVAGKTARPGLHMCNACRKQFTVTVGTIYERSHVPLAKWLEATYLICTSKKGISAHQLHRMLNVTYKTAWFMAHRIREGMREGTFSGPLGGQNKVVEADETYIGGKEANKHKAKRTPGTQGGAGKEAAFALVERDGKVRSFHVANVTAATLGPILAGQIDKKTYLMTDDAAVYPAVSKDFAGHGSVNHSIEEYVRGHFWHTNTVEGYFSILKRGITGTYHHVSQQHLKRYLAEFDFRYNERSRLGVTDSERTTKAVKGIAGKRMTYRRINSQQSAEPTTRH
jgi:transposase-like protein